MGNYYPINIFTLSLIRCRTFRINIFISLMINRFYISLIFYLFRDIAGYGTFTFFGKNHRIYEKILFNPDNVGIFTFFATIPGALVLTSLIIYFFLFIRNKFRIISSKGVEASQKGETK